MRCRNNREAMDKIVEVLIEKETIDGKEFRALLSEYAYSYYFCWFHFYEAVHSISMPL